MKKALGLVFFTLLSCSSKPIQTRDLSFATANTVIEKMIYHTSKPIAISYTSLTPMERKTPVTGYERMKLQGRDLLYDLGGLPIEIPFTDSEVVSAVYFDPALYKERQFAVYAKWKSELKFPRHAKLAEIFEIDFNGKSLTELFSLPPLTALPNTKKGGKAILVLPSHDTPFELDPRSIMMFLSRGYHVLALRYADESPLPPWKITCLSADKALTWLKHKVRCRPSDMLVYGKAFGSGPAIYAASGSRGAHLILDRPFARMSDACCLYRPNFLFGLFIEPVARSYLEKFERYPNEEWLRYVSGKCLIIEASETSHFKGHAKRLVEALIKTRSEDVRKTFIKKYWIKAPGGLHESFWSNGMQSWYSDEKTQERLTEFLREL